MREYTNALSGASTTVEGVRQAADILAALAPPTIGVGSAALVKSNQTSVTKKVVAFVPGVVGSGIGAVLWKDHRILGALVGHAAVTGGWEFYKGDKKKAACQFAVEGAGVAGALLYKKHPALGWASGIVLGAAATYFVPGSPVRRFVDSGDWKDPKAWRFW